MTNSNYISFEELKAMAITFEHASAEFYHGLIERVDNDNVKELLRILEKEEIKHEEMLKKLDSTSDDKSMLQFSPDMAGSMPSVDVETLDVRKLLEVALEREKKSVEVYSTAATMTSGSVKELLESLAMIEKEHVERVKNIMSIL